MKPLFFLILFLALHPFYAQSVEDYFVTSANLYLESKNSEALNKIEEGLTKFPQDKKLNALKKRIEQMEKDDKKEDDSKKDSGDNGEAEQKKEKNNSQNNSAQQNGQNNGEEGAGNSEQKPEVEEGKGQSAGEKSNSDLQKERYDKILKALRKQEQNTQRNLMMGRSRANSGRKEKDW